MLFAVVGLLRLGALALPGVRTGALALIALADLALAAVVWALPWERWPRWATLVLSVPAFALIVGSNASGLVSARSLGMLFVLVFVWVGGNHRRWASLWIAPLAA